MIRYRHDPDNPKKPIVEASPEDIDAFRRVVRARLRRHFSQIGSGAIDDTAQHVLIVACRAVPQGAIRGRYSQRAKRALRAWLLETAWRLGMNAKRSAEVRGSIVGSKYDVVDRRSLPDAVADARRMLRMIAQERPGIGIRTILLLAHGGTYRQIAKEMSIDKNTLLKHVHKARQRLAAFRDHGPWTEPPQPKPPSPRTRKRKQ